MWLEPALSGPARNDPVMPENAKNAFTTACSCMLLLAIGLLVTGHFQAFFILGLMVYALVSFFREASR
jgi:uncharacterized membrane protein YiaA